MYTPVYTLFVPYSTIGGAVYLYKGVDHIKHCLTEKLMMYGNCIHNNIQWHDSSQNDSVWSCYSSYTLFDWKLDSQLNVVNTLVKVQWKEVYLFFANGVHKEGSHTLLAEFCFCGVFAMSQTDSIRDGKQAAIHSPLLLLDTQHRYRWGLHQVPIECL